MEYQKLRKVGDDYLVIISDGVVQRLGMSVGVRQSLLG